MGCFLWLVIFMAAIWTAAYLRFSLVTTTVLLFVLVLGWMQLSEPSALAITITWTMFLIVFIPLNVTSIRRSLVSDRALRIFRAALPTMSQTERDALEAGTVWWDGELFSGRPDWKKLLAYPVPTLTAAEQAFLDGPVEELCSMVNDWHITEERHDLPSEVWQFIKDQGFFGMIIPKKYGGLEFSALAHSSVVMKVASRSTTAAVTVMVPNSLGPAELLLHYGTQRQKDYYLPRLAKGEEVPCFALTGPEAGSDASSIPDRGVVCRGRFEGKDMIGIRLNWEKRYITLGPVATVLGLAFKLYDPDHLLGKQEEIGITLALIPTNSPGISIGNRHMPLNIVFQNGPNWGKDVFIPLDWVIGGADRVGKGWRMLMESLAAGRSISLPALSTGAGKLASRATGAYARIRKQFKTPIGRFEGVEEVLANIAGNTYMMDAARTMTAGAVDSGEKPAVPSAIVKYNLTERMRTVVNHAMDVQGGTGICLGPRNLLGRVYQAIPISITVEGANILTRSLITFGQGAIRCHPFVLKEMQAVAETDPVQASRDFDKALFGHIGFILSNALRTLFLGLTAARFAVVPGGNLTRRYYQQLTRMSAAFAFVSDVAMLLLGGKLKRKEKLSGRLADIISHLYLASAVLKRFEDQGRPVDDLFLLRWSCQESLHTIQLRLVEILKNFPNRFVGKCLGVMVFPGGHPYGEPDDRLGHKVAGVILEPSEARDRLTAGIFISTDHDETIGRIDHALDLVIKAEPVEKKLAAAMRSGVLDKADVEIQLEQAIAKEIIAAGEAEIFRQAAAARREVITVDDFPQSYWQREQA